MRETMVRSKLRSMAVNIVVLKPRETRGRTRKLNANTGFQLA